MQRASFYSTTANTSYISHYRWGQDLIGQIQAIEEKDPIQAKDLYRLINCCDWTVSGVHNLSEKGLNVSRVTLKPKLLCSEPIDEHVYRCVVGVMDFFAVGTVEQVAGKLDGRSLKAVYTFQYDGDVGAHDCCLVSGKHEGSRILRMGQIGSGGFRLVAHGVGKFVSSADGAQIRYSGRFRNNLFDDETGNAKLSSNQMRYRGCFYKGKKHGHGVLEKYEPNLGDYYLYYEGSFGHDRFSDGLVYSPSKEILFQYRRGSRSVLSSASSRKSLSSGDSNSSLSSLSTQEGTIYSSPKLPTYSNNTIDKQSISSPLEAFDEKKQPTTAGSFCNRCC